MLSLRLSLTDSRNAVEEAMPHMENDRVVESATEARAGTTGHNVRYMLSMGIIGVVVLFAIVYVAFFG